MQAVPQVVFTDVLIVGRLDVHGQSFAPIGSHKKDAASDWLLIKRVCIGMKRLPGVQLQNQSDNSSYRRDFSIYRKKDVLTLIRAAIKKCIEWRLQVQIAFSTEVDLAPSRPE